MADTKCKQHIGEGSIMILVGTALFFDAFGFLVGFIPFVGWMITPIIMVGIGVPVITFIFWVLGVPQFKSREDLGIFATRLLELVPILNMLPWLTLSVVMNIVRQRRKDRKCFENEKRKKTPGKPVPNNTTPRRTSAAAFLGAAGIQGLEPSASDNEEESGGEYDNDELVGGGYDNQDESFDFDEEFERDQV